MARTIKLMLWLGLLLLWTTAVWAASATANIEPDGWNEGCKFNDDNGFLLDTRGADTTWANSVGTLMSCDPNCTKSELTVYGDIRHWAASERQPSDAVTPGYYDIPVLVGLTTEVVNNGGRSSNLAVYPGIQIRTDWAAFSHSATVQGATCEFTHKTHVYTFMEIGFITPGTECVGVEVDQEAEMPWTGVALAYDGAVQLEQYLLD